MSQSEAFNTNTNKNSAYDISMRKTWMATLARADLATLELAWDYLDEKPKYSFLRHPESGMVMVRARAGGEGRQFNFGEMTMTRCVVSLTDTIQGHAYISGRSKRHATLAAVFDAMMQISQHRPFIKEHVLKPTIRNIENDRAAMARKVAATKVDFFTMVRGE